MGILMTIHGELRWLIALVAVIAIVKFFAGWLGKQSFKPMDRGLMSAYAGLMDLNFVLGLLLILFAGGLNTQRIEHAVTMLIAIGIVHGSASWRKSGNNAAKFRNNLIIVAVSLVFIFVGVLRLRGGWVFS